MRFLLKKVLVSVNEKRWKMCPSCGVKLEIEYKEPELVIYHCPICKKTTMLIRGSLAQCLDEIVRETGKNLETLLREGSRAKG